jgi:hypothetical protein
MPEPGHLREEGPRHHFLYRELLQIPVTTGTSLVVSRHASLYSTGYRSPLPTSPSHYANTLTYTALQVGKRHHESCGANFIASPAN